ncbi:MAG: dienelactone hydrolase family protein [Chloroflexota bacterium]
MKTLGRILLGLLIIILLLVVGVGAYMAWDINAGVSPTDFTNVTYETVDGTTLHGYLAFPDESTEETTYPAVLMIHEWWGLNAEIIELADELASEGFVVLAPDTYRGKTAGSVPGALFLRISVDMERVMTDMDAAYAYLADLPQVNSSVGIVGFCYGGDVAFNYGLANSDLDAVINLYGSTRADSDAFMPLVGEDAAPVLAIFGAEDGMIPVEEVEAHEAALNEAGVTNTVTIYDGVGHAFVQPDEIGEPSAAFSAWQQIITFFNANLESAEPAS